MIAAWADELKAAMAEPEGRLVIRFRRGMTHREHVDSRDRRDRLIMMADAGYFVGNKYPHPCGTCTDYHFDITARGRAKAAE